MGGFNKSRNIYVCPTCEIELYALDRTVEIDPVTGEEKEKVYDCKRALHCPKCERDFIAGTPNPQRCVKCKVKVDCITYENVKKGRRGKHGTI